MSQPLRISCPHCQHQVSVEMRQAGQSISCRNCKQPFEVPTMRELRRMVQEAAGDSTSTTLRSSSSPPPSHAWKRRWFGVGLAILMIFGAAGGGMLAWARSFATELPRAQQAQIDALNRAYFEKIDAASMEQFWSIWHDEVLLWTPGDWVESNLVINRRAARLRTGLAIGLFAIAGLGLTAMVVSAFVKK